jgi:hypothetical protein
VFDKWLVWVIALLSIGAPAFFLVLVSSVGSASLDLTDLRTAAGRGEFLIPDALLLVECCRRLTREVLPEHALGKSIKVAAITLCGMLALICLAASVVLVIQDTGKTAKSADFITLWCLVAGVVAGTLAVLVKDGER